MARFIDKNRGLKHKDCCARGAWDACNKPTQPSSSDPTQINNGNARNKPTQQAPHQTQINKAELFHDEMVQ